MIEVGFYHEVRCQNYKTNKNAGNFAQGQIFPTQTQVSFKPIIIGWGPNGHFLHYLYLILFWELRWIFGILSSASHILLKAQSRCSGNYYNCLMPFNWKCPSTEDCILSLSCNKTFYAFFPLAFLVFLSSRQSYYGPLFALKYSMPLRMDEMLSTVLSIWGWGNSLIVLKDSCLDSLD